MTKRLIIALDNIRSAHNVGAIARSSLGFEVDEIWTIGVTPHLQQPNDSRLPHVIARAEQQIKKTALGGEVLCSRHFTDAFAFLATANEHNYDVVSIETCQDAATIDLFTAKNNTVFVLGNEVNGVDSAIIKASTLCLRIPISDHKESYNVAAAAAITLYAVHKQFDKICP